jgi:hypothetical protein
MRAQYLPRLKPRRPSTKRVALPRLIPDYNDSDLIALHPLLKAPLNLDGCGTRRLDAAMRSSIAADLAVGSKRFTESHPR